jgi:hypothetical protein
VASRQRCARGQFRPELLSLLIIYERAAHPNAEAMRTAVDEDMTFEACADRATSP